MFLIALFALAGSPAGSPVSIAPAPSVAPQTADPATLAEAVRLLDSEGFDETAMRSSEMAVEAALAGMTEQVQKLYGDQIPSGFVADLREAIRNHNRTTMKAKLPGMKLEAARLYASEFTKGELVHMRELQSDPVMVKARDRNRVLAPKMMMIGINAMRDSQPELEATVKRLVADYLARSNGKPAS